MFYLRRDAFLIIRLQRSLRNSLVGIVEVVPGVEDEAAGAVFTVFAEFALFENAEVFVDAALDADVFGVEDMSEFVG